MQVRLITPTTPQFTARGDFAALEARRLARNVTESPPIMSSTMTQILKRSARGQQAAATRAAKALAQTTPEVPTKKPRKKRVRKKTLLSVLSESSLHILSVPKKRYRGPKKNFGTDKLPELGRSTVRSEVCSILGRSTNYTGDF